MTVGVSEEENGNGRKTQKQEVHGNIEHLGIDFLVPKDASAYTDLEDGGGVECLENLHVDGLEQHDHAIDLEAAGGGTGAAADKAHEHQHEAGEHGPGGVVGDGKTRCGCVADYVEGAIEEGFAPGAFDSLKLQAHGSDDGHDGQGDAVETEHRIVQGPQRPLHQGHEDKAEVDGSQEHEHDGDDADDGGSESADTGRPGGETARRTHAEGMADGVENRHTRQQIAQEGGGTDAQIHISENKDRLVGPAAVIVPGEGAELHIGEPQAHRRGVGDNQQQEHHNAQTADKVSGRPPEKQASGKGFHIFQDGGPGGGKAGDALEPGVDHGKRPAPQGVGQHSEDEGEEPGQENDHITVLQGNLRGFPDEEEGEDAEDEGDGEADQERRQGRVSAVEKGDEHRQQHKEGTHQKGNAHIPRYDLQVHSCLSLRSWMRRLSWRFSSVRSVMALFTSVSWSLPSKLKV